MNLPFATGDTLQCKLRSRDSVLCIFRGKTTTERPGIHGERGVEMSVTPIHALGELTIAVRRIGRLAIKSRLVENDNRNVQRIGNVSVTIFGN